MSCKTCGGENGKHYPSFLDKQGIGALGHRMTTTKPDADLLASVEAKTNRGHFPPGVGEWLRPEDVVELLQAAKLDELQAVLSNSKIINEDQAIVSLSYIDRRKSDLQTQTKDRNE